VRQCLNSERAVSGRYQSVNRASHFNKDVCVSLFAHSPKSASVVINNTGSNKKSQNTLLITYALLYKRFKVIVMSGVWRYETKRFNASAAKRPVSAHFNPVDGICSGK